MGLEQEVAGPPAPTRENNLSEDMKESKQVIDKNSCSDEKTPDMNRDEMVVKKDISTDEKAPTLDGDEQVVEREENDDETGSDLNGSEQVAENDESNDEIAPDLNGGEQVVEKNESNGEKADLNGSDQDGKVGDSWDHPDQPPSPGQVVEPEMAPEEVRIKQEPMSEEEDGYSFPQEGSLPPEQGQCLVMKYDPEFGMTDSVVVVNPEAPEATMQMDLAYANESELDFSASVYYLPPDFEGQLEGDGPPRRGRKRKGGLSRRIMPNSQAKVFTCADCGQEFNYSHHLVNHVDAIHKQLMKYACDKCEARFAWRNQLQRHKRAVHRPGEVLPNPCVGNVQDFTENVRPVDAVTDRGAYDDTAPPDLIPAAGGVPGSVFIKQEPADDYPDFHNPVSFPPANKRKRSEKPGAPRKKKRRNAAVKEEGAEPAAKKDRPFVCVECGQEFKYSHHLRCHDNAIHKRLFNYACSECDAKFAWRNQLQRHVAAVHRAPAQDQPEQQGAEIEVREKKQKKKKEKKQNKEEQKKEEEKRQKEEKKKADKKPIVHVCGECGQEFNWQSHLKEHISAIHKQLKNYECNKCDARFAWRNQLMRHMKGHNKEASQADTPEGKKKQRKKRRKRRSNGYKHHMDDDSDDYHEHVDCKFCYSHSNSTKPTGEGKTELSL